MFRRLRASWQLTKACFSVLQKDKELMLFPVLCGILTVLCTVGFIWPACLLLDGANSEESVNLSLTVLGLVYSFVTYSIVIFFNVAVLSCARMRFQGGDPTLKDGFKAGFDNIGVIFAWAAFGGLVSFIIRQLEESLGFLGSILGGLLGGAFAVVSYFAIPVMVFEKAGPVAAFKRSGAIIKKTWGEALGAYLGFSIITTIAAFAIIFSFVGSVLVSVSTESMMPMGVAGGLSLLLMVLVSVVTSCLSQIFQAALYVYATTGEVPTEIGNDLVEQAFQVKKGRKWVLVGEK